MLAVDFLKALFYGVIFMGLFSAGTSSAAKSFDHSYKAWDDFLKSHVKVYNDGQQTAVDYASIDKKSIGKITESLLKVTEKEVHSWDKNQRLAYFINLYNALTIQFIMTEYPKYKSIKKYTFFSPWKKDFFKLFGKKTDLDTIEHKKIRGAKDFDEPRIHFAVNCASIGCPALRAEAFVAERLTEQLQDSMEKFLRDRQRNCWDPKKKELQISPIIADWYSSDFEKGHLGYKSVEDFVKKNAVFLVRNPDEQKLLSQGGYEIQSTRYDWNLNDSKSMPKSP